MIFFMEDVKKMRNNNNSADYLECMFVAVFFVTSMKIQVQDTKWAKI